MGQFSMTILAVAGSNLSGNQQLIPDDWHEPLRQRMVLLNEAGEVARAFYAYMNEPAAREIMERYGFVLPNDM